MVGVEYDIKEILEEHFGERGIFLLAGELKSLGLAELDTLNQEERQKLAEHIMADLFANTVSDRHYAMIERKVYRALDLSTGEITQDWQ